jgi:pimeloyl-ACP methyl ester carboxylesterase
MNSGLLGRRDILKATAAIYSATSFASAGAPTADTVCGLAEMLGRVQSPAQVPVHSGLAQLPDVKLWYWDTGGAAAPVVLMHPMTGSALVWEYQQPVLASAGYRVIAYSRRGYHGSEPGPMSNPGTAAGDLFFLARTLNLGRFHLIASAGGAFGALDYAISYPETLYSLVLACSTLNIQESELDAQLRAITPPGFAALPPEFCELGPAYRAVDPRGVQRWKELQQMSRVADNIEQGFINRIRWDSLQAMRVPTLVISGDADLYAPPPIMAVPARHMPHSCFAIIGQCGHSAYWERPVQFNELILRFLRLSKS